jgi:hypothetical protein
MVGLLRVREVWNRKARTTLRVKTYSGQAPDVTDPTETESEENEHGEE